VWCRSTMEMEKPKSTSLPVALHSLILIRIRYVPSLEYGNTNCLRIQILTVSTTLPSTAPSQEITCPEAVKLDDLDIAAITQNYDAARAAFNSAESGSIAAAEAQIAVEVNKDMALALGVVLA
jgi:hypothetical protein